MFPSHEAFRLLKKWKDEEATIRLLFTLSFGAGTFIGKVASVEGTNVHFLSADGSSDFLLSLIAASFEYRQQRDDPESTASDSYKRSLIATFPSRAKIVFPNSSKYLTWLATRGANTANARQRRTLSAAVGLSFS
jgi:hypothetical protein